MKYEKGIFYSFFIIRRLIESRKVSDAIRNKIIKLNQYRPTGTNVTYSHRHDIDELYDLAAPIIIKKPLDFVCNQIIHSYVFTLLIEDSGRRTSIIFCSDWERNKAAYRMTRGTLVRTLRMVGNNWPKRMSAIWDRKKGDYQINIK